MHLADLIKKFVRVEAVLIILILFGVFFRFYHLNVPLNGDEIIFGISALKIHKQGFEAGKDFVAEHPPLGKWLVGLPSEYINADYKPLKLLGRDMFFWAYIAYDALAKNYIAIRVMEAIGGVISLVLIFLITRQLFGSAAAFWSTTIATLSFEMVAYSRVIFLESPMILFTFLTLFLYINYVKSTGKKRNIYIALFVASLTVTLLTRHIQPLFLLPIFVVSQFLVNRNIKENIYFLIFIGISYYVAFHVIFPQDILSFGQSRFGYSGFLGFFSFKFSIILHLIFRNSFLFLASLLSLGYIAFQQAKHIKKINLNTFTNNIHSLPIIFFVMAFLFFSLLSFPLPRHYIFMFLPLYILGGYALDKISKNKIVAVVLILIAGFNAVQLVQYFPSFLTYTNFGLKGFQSFPTMTFEELPKRLVALHAEKTSTVMTNDVNVLIFYDGNKLPLIPSLVTLCKNETIQSLDVKNLTLLYVPHSSQFNFNTDPFVCPLLKEKIIQAGVKILEL